MMPILVKSDDVRRGRKVTVCHGRLRAAQASMGWKAVKCFEIANTDTCGFHDSFHLDNDCFQIVAEK